MIKRVKKNNYAVNSNYEKFLNEKKKVKENFLTIKKKVFLKSGNLFRIEQKNNEDILF